MLLAAKAKGYNPKLILAYGTLMEQSSSSTPTLAATLDLASGVVSTSDLYEAIPKRHTDRGPYDKMHSVSSAILQDLSVLASKNDKIKVFLFTTEEKQKLFIKGSLQATKVIINDSIMSHDSAKWFRHNWGDVQKHKDGPYIDTAGVSPFMRTMVKILPPVSEETENSYWLKATEATLTTTPVMGFIGEKPGTDHDLSIP